jgi:RHS repeat-associated protein
MTETTFKNLRDEVLANEAHLVVTSPDNTTTTSLTKSDFLMGSTADELGRKYAATPVTQLHGVPPSVVNALSTTLDARKRIIGDGTLTYTHDAQDRLVLVKRGTTEEQRIAYDGFGRRRLERMRTGAGATGTATTENVLEYWEGNVIEEAATTSTTSTGITFATTHAPGIDVPAIVTVGPSSTAFPFVLATNARGDVTSAIRDSNGVLLEEQDLDPWGERTLRRNTTTCVDGGESGTAPNKVSRPLSACGPTAAILGRFGIGGARQHARTKLVDLRNRVYATHLRMFLSKDPLGNIDAEGLFAYVAGDPINFRDPWGLEAKKKAAAEEAEKKAAEEAKKKADEEAKKRAEKEARRKDIDDCEAGNESACDRLPKNELTIYPDEPEDDSAEEELYKFGFGIGQGPINAEFVLADIACGLGVANSNLCGGLKDGALATDDPSTLIPQGIGLLQAKKTKKANGSFKALAAANLKKLGLGKISLAGKSFSSGKKALGAAGFEHVGTTPTGRQIFRHPQTGAEVFYDSGGALFDGQKPHWHIRDNGGNSYDRSGRPVDKGSEAGHIPAG